MNTIKKLHLISRVSEELDNHMGLSDEILAEFVIAMGANKNSPSQMRETLAAYGVILPEELVETLFHLMHRLGYSELIGEMRTKNYSFTLDSNNRPVNKTKILKMNSFRSKMDWCDEIRKSEKVFYDVTKKSDELTINTKSKENEKSNYVKKTQIDDKIITNSVQRTCRVLYSPERFELNQMIASGISSDKIYELFSSRSYSKQNNNIENQFEIDINEEEPEFLRGRTEKTGCHISPPRIVRAPDGSLNRSAMTASALVKERRELKHQQEKNSQEFIPVGLSKPWEDPIAEKNERHFVTEIQGINLKSCKVVGSKNSILVSTFGKVDHRSIKDQRESLPIYLLREEFIKAVKHHQILIAIGETGSGKTTQITQYLAETGLARQGFIACTQPRRVAAQSIAKRVAEEVGCRKAN
jgi:hypothetical protein